MNFFRQPPPPRGLGGADIHPVGLGDLQKWQMTITANYSEQLLLVKSSISSFN